MTRAPASRAIRLAPMELRNDRRAPGLPGSRHLRFDWTDGACEMTNADLA